MSAAKCALGVVTVVTLAGVGLAAGQTRKDLHFNVGKRPTISINNPYGPIVVKAGGAREVVINAVLHSDKVEIDQSQGRNRIDIVSHLLQGADPKSGVVEYQVSVPGDASLSVHAENGAIHAEKLHGDITIEGNSGSIEVVDCADGHVHAGGERRWLSRRRFARYFGERDSLYRERRRKDGRGDAKAARNTQWLWGDSCTIQDERAL